VYPRETHIAEKLHAYTLPRKRPNSRVKDLPDIALLSKIGALDGAVLRSALERTFTFAARIPFPRLCPNPLRPGSLRTLEWPQRTDFHGPHWRKSPRPHARSSIQSYKAIMGLGTQNGRSGVLPGCASEVDHAAGARLRQTRTSSETASLQVQVRR
jgi:hypothetical protein